MTHTAPTWRTPPQLAREIGCDPETVISWIRRGELAAVNLASDQRGRPRYKIAPEAVETFLARRAVTPPAPPQRRRKRDTANVIQFF